MLFQVCAAVWQKGNSFRFQHLTLDFLAAKSLVATKGPVGVDHPVAGQTFRRPVHGRPHNTGSPGASCQEGQLPIGGQASSWDLAHKLVNLFGESIHFKIPLSKFVPHSANRLLRPKQCLRRNRRLLRREKGLCKGATANFLPATAAPGKSFWFPAR